MNIPVLVDGRRIMNPDEFKNINYSAIGLGDKDHEYLR
jgi:hypothetical protein